jgi:hypothetical protein
LQTPQFPAFSVNLASICKGVGRYPVSLFSMATRQLWAHFVCSDLKQDAFNPTLCHTSTPP